LAASHKFDLLHHLTMTGYREPGYLWSLPLPFVWGPIGGFVMMPWRFLPSLGPRGFRQCAVRNVLNAIQARCSPRVRQAVRAARVLFASTSVDRSALARFYRRDAILLGENGADISQLAEPRQLSRTRDEAADVCRTPLAPREGKHHAERDEYGSYSGRYPQGGTTNGAKGRPLRIAWSGLHIPRKALPILLGAVELASKEVPVEVSILGDGPENSRWRSLAKRLKIDGLCRFYGWLPRAEAIEVMRSADLFAVTSLQDATSAVLFEALSAGLPVISHACCGFQDVLTDHCAVLVPMTSPTASIHGFAAAIKRVYAENTLYEQLSRGAIERARELSWENRANVILHAYQQVLGP
jgi:glycosyltransferase involved in cell wall biosynthesis